MNESLYPHERNAMKDLKLIVLRCPFCGCHPKVTVQSGPSFNGGPHIDSLVQCEAKRCKISPSTGIVRVPGRLYDKDAEGIAIRAAVNRWNHTVMKALSLTQPWATLVAIGAKSVETRSWRTDYRGPIAIHAALRFPTECKQLCYSGHFLDVLSKAGYENPLSLPLGCILAVGNIVECYRTEEVAHTFDERERAFGDYTPGRFAICLERVRRLWTPPNCKGKLGLWTVPEDIVEYIEAGLRKPPISTGASDSGTGAKS